MGLVEVPQPPSQELWPITSSFLHPLTPPSLSASSSGFSSTFTWHVVTQSLNLHFSSHMYFLTHFSQYFNFFLKRNKIYLHHCSQNHHLLYNLLIEVVSALPNLSSFHTHHPSSDTGVSWHPSLTLLPYPKMASPLVLPAKNRPLSLGPVWMSHPPWNLFSTSISMFIINGLVRSCPSHYIVN